MGQSSTCEQDKRDFSQGQVFTRFDKYHQREQEEKRSNTLRPVSSCAGGLELATTTKKQRKSIHGTPAHKIYSISAGNQTMDQVNIIINNCGETVTFGTADSPNSLSPQPATPQSAGSALSRRRGHSSASPQTNYFVNNIQTNQLMINQDVIQVKRRNDQDSDDEEEDPAIQRRSRRKSFSLFKGDKRTNMF